MHARLLLLALIALLANGCGPFVAVPVDADAAENRETSVRHELVRYARSLVGKPYRPACTEPDRGFDCSGLVQHVYARYGIELPRVSADQAAQGKDVPRAKVQPADLVAFRRTPGGRVFHVGIVSAVDGRGIHMIHSSSSRGVVEEVIGESSYWRGKIAEFRNLMGQ